MDVQADVRPAANSDGTVTITITGLQPGSAYDVAVTIPPAPLPPPAPSQSSVRLGPICAWLVVDTQQWNGNAWQPAA